MRELLVIGMGPGHPDQITVQAVQALNRVDVFFRIDKGDAKSGLNAAREEILRRHVSGAGYRVVDIPEPPRDRSPDLTAAGYRDAVRRLARGPRRAHRGGDRGRARGGRRRRVPGLGRPVGLRLDAADHRPAAGPGRGRLRVHGHPRGDQRAGAGGGASGAAEPGRRADLHHAGPPDRRRAARGAGQRRRHARLGVHRGGVRRPGADRVLGRLPQHGGRDADQRTAGRGGRPDHRDRAELRARHGWIMDTYLLRRD